MNNTVHNRIFRIARREVFRIATRPLYLFCIDVYKRQVNITGIVKNLHIESSKVSITSKSKSTAEGTSILVGRNKMCIRDRDGIFHQ